MIFEFRLPDIGEGVVEGQIQRWMVREGDSVVEDQPLVEIETDKVTVEIPSPKAGRVVRCFAAAGDTIEVGTPLVTIETEGVISESLPGASHLRHAAAPVTVKPEAANVSDEAAAPTEATASTSVGDRVLAAPAVRKLARERGIELSKVRGTGRGGQVTRDDVLHASQIGAEAQGKPRAADTLDGSCEERLPLRGLRKRIAERMTRATAVAAHFTYADEADLTELVALRERAIQSLVGARGIRLTYLPFIIKAVVGALKHYPMINASLDDERQEIVIKKYYNIGFATAVGENLIVPVIKDADRKNIIELAEELERLASAARSNDLKVEDTQGGTFTVTSLGPLGGLFATPIINYPEVGILGVNKLRRAPIVKDEQIVIRDVATFSASFDHRIINGLMAAQFMREVLAQLENPQRLDLAGIETEQPA